MSEILIKGIQMPKEVNHPLFIRILSDGHIAKGDFLKGGFIETEAKAIEVPTPHGNLADKKVIYDKMVENIKIVNKEDFGSKKAKEAVLMAYKAVLYELGSEIPTIIEASN